MVLTIWFDDFVFVFYEYVLLSLRNLFGIQFINVHAADSLFKYIQRFQVSLDGMSPIVESGLPVQELVIYSTCRSEFFFCNCGFVSVDV